MRNTTMEIKKKREKESKGDKKTACKEEYNCENKEKKEHVVKNKIEETMRKIEIKRKREKKEKKEHVVRNKFENQEKK